MTIPTPGSATLADVPIPSPSSAYVAELRRTWQLVVPMADEAAELFYARLFELDPSLRVLFQTDAAVRRRKLMDALGLIVTCVDRPHDLLPMLAALGARHVSYGVRAAHYVTVGEALMWTLDQGLGALHTADARAAWGATYEFIAAAMVRGETTGQRP